MSRILCIALVIALSFPVAAAGQGRGELYATRYANIQYDSTEDFKAFEKNLKGGLFFKAHGPGSGYLAEIIDGLFEKVEFYLDMYPKGLKIRIVVCEDGNALEKAYRGLGIKGGVPQAFYYSKNKSVYINAREAGYGVMAHEFAHAIINAYFDNSVPAKTQEILAHYVDEQISQSY